MGCLLVRPHQQSARGDRADRLLLFIRRLDDLQILAENRARRTGADIETPISLPGQASLRWSTFKDYAPEMMHRVVAEDVFPFLRALGGHGSTYSDQVRDARLALPTPALLDKAVGLLDGIPMNDRDTNGDLYEYLLSKIASAGANGQFRTPRHIIELMVDLMDPQPGDEICDPACGTAGFLVKAVSTSASTTRRPDRRHAARALPPLDVPWLRLRLHHVALTFSTRPAPRSTRCASSP